MEGKIHKRHTEIPLLIPTKHNKIPAVIKFMVPVIDANGALVTVRTEMLNMATAATEGNYIRYRLDETNLIREILGSDGSTILSVKNNRAGFAGLKRLQNTANSRSGL